jgi:hypothetical protein
MDGDLLTWQAGALAMWDFQTFAYQWKLSLFWLLKEYLLWFINSCEL